MNETANTEEPAAILPYEGTLRVNFYDIDFAGIVSNIVFVRWLEDLRTAWCDQHLPLTEQLAAGCAPIVATTEIAYKAPICFGDSVRGKVSMSAKRVRWVADIEIWNGETLAAQARQTGAFVDLKTLKPIPIPARLAKEFAVAGEHLKS